MGIIDRIQHGWNAFMNKDPTNNRRLEYEGSYSYRPDRIRFIRGNESTLISSIKNRIALDVAAINVQHVRLDSNDRFLETIDSGLNSCLTLSANLDQTGRAFLQDAALTLMDKGCIAILPIDTSIDPEKPGSVDINSLRVGTITSWYPQAVRVNVYNEKTGRKEELVVSKSIAAIIENPFYPVMNETNSTMNRLARKFTLSDMTDEGNASGKLDLIIQLPYSVRTERQKDLVNNRKQAIEDQLTGSKYGIAYIDSTEHVTQLNRPVENTLLKQIEYLTETLYSQLGLTQSILDGTADEKTMLNYYDRTVEPIISAIVDEMKRKFLTKTARTQKQSLMFFRDPFKLVPVSEIAEMADKFTRNEILTSNEVRQLIGMIPSDDPGADELRNKNLSQSKIDQANSLGFNPNNLEDQENEKVKQAIVRKSIQTIDTQK